MKSSASTRTSVRLYTHTHTKDQPSLEAALVTGVMGLELGHVFSSSKALIAPSTPCQNSDTVY